MNIYFTNHNGIDLLIGNFFYIKNENGVTKAAFKHELTNGLFITPEVKNELHEMFSQMSTKHFGKEVCLEFTNKFFMDFVDCKKIKCFNNVYSYRQCELYDLPLIENIDLVTDKHSTYYKLKMAIDYFRTYKSPFHGSLTFNTIYKLPFASITIDGRSYLAYKHHEYNCRKKGIPYTPSSVRVNIGGLRMGYDFFKELIEKDYLVPRLEGLMKKRMKEIK